MQPSYLLESGDNQDNPYFLHLAINHLSFVFGGVFWMVHEIVLIFGNPRWRASWCWSQSRGLVSPDKHSSWETAMLGTKQSPPTEGVNCPGHIEVKERLNRREMQQIQFSLPSVHPNTLSE